MSEKKLQYLAVSVISELKNSIKDNIGRYREGDFLDLVGAGGWSIDTSISADLTRLADLDPSGGADSEIHNSLLVWEVLGHISPSLACEDRIWSRLTHVECLNFSRARWLKSNKDEVALVKAVGIHFFASTQTACRDDNAISRLWWNSYIANQASPGDLEGALRLILKKADIRSNYVERSWMVSRTDIASEIIKAMLAQPWVTDKEDNYRKFMKALNRKGGGVLFEILDASEKNILINECVSAAMLM